MKEGKFTKLQIEKDGVITISLNRPEIHNAFNDEFIEELITHFNEINENDNYRLLILTGMGKSFCAGADLNWMKKMASYSKEENFNDSLRLAELFRCLNNIKIPVLGKVNGAALGGGVGLVACCDYVVASDRAKFGLTEVNLGLIPAVISPFVIEKIGFSNARALFLSGEIFKGEKACEIGLVHKVCPPESLDEATQSVILDMLSSGPMAQIAAKKLVKDMRKLWSESSEVIRDHTCDFISQIRVSAEGQEGMSALLEKRDAAWRVKS